MLWGVYLLKMKSFKSMNFSKADNWLQYFEQGGMYNPFDDVDNCFILTHGDSPMDPGNKDLYANTWTYSALQINVMKGCVN